MATEISKLLEALLDASAHKDLSGGTHLDPLRPGLLSLHALLASALRPAPDGQLGLRLWSRPQIAALASVAKLVVAAATPTPVDRLEPVVVAIVEKSVELCVSFLELSEFDSDDLRLENDIAQLLEIALLDGGNWGCSRLFDFSDQTILESLPSIPDVGSVEVSDHQSRCWKDKKKVDRVLMTSTSGSIQQDGAVQSMVFPFPHVSRSTILYAQNWAVAHVKCMHRILVTCKELFNLSMCSTKRLSDGNFKSRNLFALAVLKLLGKLARDSPYVAIDCELLNAVVFFANNLLALFQHGFEFGYCDTMMGEDSVESQFLLLLEEFIGLVRTAFGDGCISQNIQTCIAAEMMDWLDADLWNYDRMMTSLHPPIVYFPKVILYLLRLVRNIKNQRSQALNLWEKFDMYPSGCLNREAHAYSWDIGPRKVFLLKNHSQEEHLRLIFHPSKRWTENLICVVFFLHSEGIKSRLKVERLCSIQSKISVSSGSDSPFNQEDDALFGNLFSEAARPLGAADGRHEQSSCCPNVPVCHYLIHASMEVLTFLKTCAFSPEWSGSIYSDACKKIDEMQITSLLSILSSQSWLYDERSCESSGVSLPERNINDICFELLQNLFANNVLSTDLEEHLVSQILKVESGKYIYNNYTLTLLAHVFISRLDATNYQLATNAYEGFVNFIVEKAKNISSCCLELNDLLECLPTVFHLEVLLMAFHLSRDAERASMANIVLNSLKALDSPISGCNAKQVSSWGLLVSRLLLVMQHMFLYPTAFPSWLLMQLKSRLGEVSHTLHSPSSLGNHYLVSWTSLTVKSIMTEYEKDATVINNLLPHLIDFYSPSSTDIQNKVSFLNLKLDSNELISALFHILSIWEGRKAESVEDLILERYIFMLCWDTSFLVYSSCRGPLSDWKNPSFNEKSFFYLGQLLLRDADAEWKDVDFYSISMNLLNQLQFPLQMEMTIDHGWDFLRNGSFLSLLVSLIYSGIWRYAVRHEVDRVEPPWNECVRGDSPLSVFAENLIGVLFQENHVDRLICILSSCLKVCLKAFQEAFLNVFDRRKCFLNGFSPMLLLKHTSYDGCIKDELLEKCGSDSGQLDFCFSLLPKLDNISRERNAGCVDFFHRHMLHGIPCYPDVCSAAFLSCILIIQDIVYALDGLLKVRNRQIHCNLDKGLLHDLMTLMMSIKSDSTFRSIHEKCGEINANLDPMFKGSTDYCCLFQLKDVENFLMSMNLQDTSDCNIHETLVITAVDLLERLKRESSTTELFRLYLNADSMPAEANEIFGSQQGDLLVLINALDKCCSEAVTVKVLNFFVDLFDGPIPCPGIKEKVLQRFMETDMSRLSKWAESRLLGSIAESPDGVVIMNECPSVREATMKFMNSLLCQLNEPLSGEFHHRLVQAMLISLDNAFISYDICTAKAFFNFLLEFLNGKPLIKQLLEKVVPLIQKLGDDEGSLQVLKFLLGFLGVVLGDCGSHKNIVDKLPGKLSSNNSFGAGSQTSGQVSRKRSDSLVLADNPGTASAHLDCEAISADEDEDDGTSDGELVSIEKDEEDDSNSEKALASKVCTFTSSGSNFMEQHWYFCYTCDLTVSKGCCSVCAKVCHRGHRVVYSRSSRFFCDCGAGGVRGNSCQCLKPRKFAGCNSVPVRNGNNLPSFMPLSEVGDQVADSDSDLDDDVCTDIDNLKLSIPRELQHDLATFFEHLGLEDRVLELCDKLLPSVTSRRNLNISKEKKVILVDDKVLSYNAENFQLKKTYKGGSFDLKIRADYSNCRELKSHLSSGSLTKSLLSISGRGRLAAGEGDKVSIFDVGQLIGHPTGASATADKPKSLSKNTMRFEIVSLMFNPIMENYLLVTGYEECQILTVNPRGEVTDRLAVELALQGAHIRRANWVPGSQVQLLVVTNLFVKIYDLSQDNISPIHYFMLEDDSIVDAVLIAAPMGKFILLVMSELGSLFRLELSMECAVGAKPLKEIVEVPKKEAKSKGLSLHYSPSYRLLFLAYQDGTTLVGYLDTNALFICEVSALHEIEHEGKLRPAALRHWKELLTDSGVFVCFSSLKHNAALSVSLSPHELFAQNMRHAGGSSLSVVGIAACKPLSKDKSHCLVLHDDGSLQIYIHTPIGGDSTHSSAFDQAKKIGAGLLNNKAYATANPEFPLDFFEKTMCITADVKFSSEAIKNSDSEGTKQRLASDDGFLESPSPAGFKISASNMNPELVMVGFRVHVGNSSPMHIPSDIAIFHRKIKLDEGMHSWYDAPFTVAESLLADEEFVISVGPTFDGSSLPRIDSLEVYGRSKDEFGWREKMDTILAMEADLLGSTAGAPGSGKKCRAIKASSAQEQVLVDALKLLSKLYSLRKSQICTEIEDADGLVAQLKCKNILEKFFESDREPLLQSASCHVLQAIFHKKEVYYHVKDTMCLLGVVKSSPTLASWTGVGGAAAKWVIKEFTAKMRAVSKITMLRRSNIIAFLETHGSGVVDGLMHVLWGILDLDQPDTQTINNVIIHAVELIYSYAECLAFQKTEVPGCSVAPAVRLLKKLIFAPYESVQTSSSLAISSRLLQVPFPKQTMLATDDSTENPSAIHSRLDGANSIGGNVQAVLEEESGTSSVQYCCDGCSTVPILRCRWHCNVCPDFDLCEACYESMDADRLPPPHSKDHPMSAIPIEMDSMGIDGNEIQFSMEELGDGSLIQGPTNVRMQSSPPAHVLESNESGEFPVSDQRVVSISASKRAVNSLLLLQLIAELKGWMMTTSGIRAIPVMQLFYRLSSAVGGPFMDSSKPENLDLKKFVKWFLDEINLDKPFNARTRSAFGEITILIFMFFTLMLRNWHQPGNDSSQSKVSGVDMQDKNSSNIPSSLGSMCSNVDQEREEFASQLFRACSYLRQQGFINYLMDILHQLVPHFKSSSSATEVSVSLPSNSGCGSLLAVRKELPAGNYSPFFSDSYAKAHRTDLFMDYHKLLLENTFRLVYSLVRPEKHERSADKDKIYRAAGGKDLKLDGYQDVLCNYISNPNTSFVRRYARRLFLHLCGSKSHYYNVRDSWQFSHEVKRLYKLVSKSGGLQNAIPYERSVKLVKCLSTIAEVAAVRPRNWQKYCSKHGDILSFLIEGVFFFTEESIIQALKLLNLALYPGKDALSSSSKTEGGDTGSSSGRSATHSADSKKKRKVEDGTEASTEKLCLDMEHAVEILFLKEANVLSQFIDTFLLDWNSSSVRAEAKCVLHGAWYHGKRAFKERLLTALLQKIKCLPIFGQIIVECFELLTLLLGKVPDGSKLQDTELITQCLTSDIISSIFETLHSQNELLANHPNSRIYNTLSALVEFDGYYLESEPCVACSCPEVPYSRMKLETLKFETKYTDNRIIVKCTGSYTIQSVTMNVHDARKSKSVKVLNLYYNNRPVSDLSELKNNWPLWKRAKSCQLAFNQTELKVEFPIPITACNFMIELDSFYENLQASSLESLQCPRCSRPVTDKHGICSNCHENAYQCRQCRNINYENLDSFLCNECGYSKYGRFEFNFMARPSFLFDSMENDEDMKKGLATIDCESENAHRRYQQLMGFKKPLLKLVSSIGEHEMDSQQKDTVQQMMVSLPGPSCKINRKIALLGVLYGEKCKAAFDSVSKSVQTLQGLRRVLMTYLEQKSSGKMSASTRFSVPRSPNNCYGCATTFVALCMDVLQVLSKFPSCRKQLVAAGILSELFENNIHQGPKAARTQARAVLCAFSEGDANALSELNNLIQKKVMYCLEHHRSMDIAQATREELLLLSETCAVVDDLWEARLRIAFQLLFASIRRGAKNPVISEHIILPCLRIVSQACTPPKSEVSDQTSGKSGSLSTRNEDSTNLSSVGKSASEFTDKHLDACRRGQDIPLLSYSEWERGATYLDFVRRQYKISQAVKANSQRSRQGSQRADYLALKYGLRWKRLCCKRAAKSDFSSFGLGSWVAELILSSCSQSIRAEVCNLISLLCPQNSPRRFQLLNLLMTLLPSTLSVGENAAEYFELFFKVIDSETSRLFLTAKGFLATICRLLSQEVVNIESQERSLNIDISQGFIIHKLVELLSKFLELPNIRFRFMRDELLTGILESLTVIRGLVVQKTKLISDCNKLLKDLLDSLLLESNENKRQFIRACISSLQVHGKERKGRTCQFILEQLCNIICPCKPEPVYHLILNKAHSQEEFIRGSMTKNPYSSTEIGPLMRDVKNKICHQLDLLGLLEDDYGMELLVAGNIISLDLSISQVYEQVWKKSQSQVQNALANSALLASGGLAPGRDCPPMTVTYRLQGLDGEATEPMIKELEEEREESLDPEIEFSIAGAVREFGGLEIILSMIQSLRDDDLKSNREELGSVLNLLLYCCKIRENRRALLRLGALGLLLETARRAFSVDAMEPAEGILLIVESLTIEANESDVGTAQGVLTVSNEEAGAGDQAKKIVLMFLERLSHPSGLKMSNKQQRNNEMVARILPYLTYGEPAAMDALIDHFNPYLQDWIAFDCLQKKHRDNPKDENLGQQASKQRSEVENFVCVSESLKTSSCGERLKDIILEKGITAAAVQHLRQCFAVTGQARFKTSAEWQNGLKLPSVPLILCMLRGVSRGHFATQKNIDEAGILPLLHALEGASGENEIGARAENLLDTLSDKENNADGFLGEEVHKLRHATRNEMRLRALRKREELLQGLGMRQELASDGGERIVVARPLIEGLEDVEEEEDGLACMVCREGYTLRPNDMLGVYTFSKRVNLGTGSSGSSRGECVYTTVSHFNIIHFQCHQEAKRADAALKNPKKEWDGATLRNNETLCNSIFPLKGPSIPLAQYIRCADQYWDNLSALGRADGSRLRLLTYDIVLMLARFATGASFSTDSKGGGKESNSCFLPFMIQMACHLLDQGTSGQQRRSMAKSISTFLSSTSAVDSPTRSPAPSSGRLTSGPSDETVQFMMVNSLLSESYEEWRQHLLAFLQRGIYHAYMQHTHGRSTLRLSSDPEASVVRPNESLTDSTKLFTIVQPMLVYTGLIEQLQRLVKYNKSTSARPSKELEGDSSGSSASLERWEVVMRERLVNMKEMLGFSKELLSWLEDMTTSKDLQEAFDVMGVLRTVLSSGYSTCEDFVQAAITVGRG